jgi:hypothetical protein
LTSAPLASRSISRFIQLVSADRICPPRLADQGRRFGGLVDQLVFGNALDPANRRVCAGRPNLPIRLADHSQGFGGRVDQPAFGIALDLAIR